MGSLAAVVCIMVPLSAIFATGLTEAYPLAAGPSEEDNLCSLSSSTGFASQISFWTRIYTAIAGGITSEAIFYHISIPRPLAMASIVFLAELARFLTWLIFIPTAVSRYIESGPLDAALSFPGRIHPGPCGGFLHPGLHSYAKSTLHPLLVLLAFLGCGLVAEVAGFFLAPAMVGVVTGIYREIGEDWMRL